MSQMSAQTLPELGTPASPRIRLVQDGTSSAPGAPAPGGRRILVVDADVDPADSLVTQLRRYGHEPVAVQCGGQALQAHPDADLVLLALELPDLDGLEVCRAIRAVSRVPVVIVTARQSELDCVLGLQAGADDYVTKPYGLRELMARIEAVMRRTHWQPAAPRDIRRGRLHIDVDSREVTVGGSGIALTRKEFDLLCLLASHPDTVIPRKQLLKQVWGDSWSQRTVDTHVSSLRGKLGGSGWIVTVRGVGFKLGAG
ncbi:response regulator transcription factor [Streptomyces coelicoflavus]|uniref:Sensory transduction protein RegX3 n=2 Tax=Streptomyces coelicoflavus TaxID=285562 RepID=A0A7K3PR96_9ACTN|nr:response regulator transcription factor [Streptomyces coelicoflavus]NEB12367.1 response regulator transcription factor [Streptomyces coelicoflavus]